MADNESKPTEGGPAPILEPQAADAAAADEVARLKAELEDVKDRALRGWAELENYRKRAARQIEEERRYAALPLMRDLLPVLDNVKRAVDSAEKNHDVASLLEGIKLVVQQLEGVLARHHCTLIQPCTNRSTRMSTTPSCTSRRPTFRRIP
jgi:molecular chaperone GrpE